VRVIQTFRYKLKWFLAYRLSILLKQVKIRNLIRDSGYFVDDKKLLVILNLFGQSPNSFHEEISRCAVGSKSQNAQDLLVLHLLKFKRDGFFVEFGATDGVELSNTFILEKNFNWGGILSEPAQIWRSRLVSSRNSFIDFRCVDSVSGKSVQFSQTKSFATHSGISEFIEKDFESAKRYKVETVSLLDLLDHYCAPTVIDYLSVDTEGSEFSIMENYDFSKYRFRIVTIEHNLRQDADKLKDLFIRNGYFHVFQELSDVEHWFVDEELYSYWGDEYFNTKA
jgi:hypothetical protein